MNKKSSVKVDKEKTAKVALNTVKNLKKDQVKLKKAIEGEIDEMKNLFYKFQDYMI